MLIKNVNRRSFLQYASVAGLTSMISCQERRLQGSNEELEIKAASQRVRSYIEQAKNAALAELKSTSKEIEHGLDIHRNSIVCDTMGSGPGVDGKWGLFSPKMAQIVRNKLDQYQNPDRELALQLKADMGKYRTLELVSDRVMQQDHRALWEAKGVTLGLSSKEPWLPEDFAMRTYAYENMDHVEKVVDFDHIEEIKSAGKHAIVFHNHGAPVIDESMGPLETLDRLYTLGIRFSQLTHGFEGTNAYCGGQNSEPDVGLTDLGREMIKRMNELGIVPDASHMSPQSTLETVNASDGPVTVSHACCRSVDHGYSPYRNLTDEGLKAIADSGGFVGICSHPDLTGDYSVEAFLRHVDHAVKLIGPEHVAISTDYTILMGNAPKELLDILHPKPLKSIKQAGQYPGFNKWLNYEETWKLNTQPTSLSACNWPYMFTAALVKRGYSDEVIRKIIGENVIRIMKPIIAKRPATEVFYRI